MENGYKDYETLIELTKTSIRTKAVRDVVLTFMENTPVYFRTAPASFTGKYHPAYTLGEGGLARHTIAALKILNHMLAVEWAKKAFSQLHMDKMRAAIIIHDTRKQGDTGEDREAYKIHELLAADAFEKAAGAKNTDIGRMVRCHMGEWGAQHPEKLDEYLVHLADYLASRKDVTLDTE